MLRFLWLSIKTILSAFLLALALIMLFAPMKFGWKSFALFGPIALILIAMAALPWLIPAGKKREIPKRPKKPFFISLSHHLPAPRNRIDVVIYVAMFSPLFLYALFATYISLINLFSFNSTPIVTEGTVESIIHRRNNNKLVLLTEQGEMKFYPACGAHEIYPGDRISVAWRDSQRHPFSGLRTTIVIYKNESIVCSIPSAEPERWLATKLLDVVMTIFILTLLALTADLLLAGLGLKGKPKALPDPSPKQEQ